MTGAAIASAGMNIYNGASASSDAKEAKGDSQMEQWQSEYYQGMAMDSIEGNQGNIDEFKSFLTSMSDQGIDYAQGLMDDWENSFGGVEDNLTDYYNNLDPAKFAVGEKAKYKQNLDKQMLQYNETMAASGLQSAGMKRQTAKEAAFKTAETNSQIDLASDEYVRDQKKDWLAFGEPRRNTADSAMGTALDKQADFGIKGFGLQQEQDDRITSMYLSQAGVADTNAGRYGESAAGYESASGSYFGSAMSSGLTGAFGKDGQGGLFGGSMSGTNDPLYGSLGGN